MLSRIVEVTPLLDLKPEKRKKHYLELVDKDFREALVQLDYAKYLKLLMFQKYVLSMVNYSFIEL